MHEVSDRGEPRASLAMTARRVWPSPCVYWVGTPEIVHFRGSILGLRIPLSTLRTRPHGRLRMTRGRRGWLGLRRTTLPFAPPRRFNPAHTRQGHLPHKTCKISIVAFSIPAAKSVGHRVPRARQTTAKQPQSQSMRTTSNPAQSLTKHRSH